MIISASYRTDIPAFYADWFVERLALGRVDVRNPYSARVDTVDLRPQSVDGFVFWTRNMAPFTDALRLVEDAGYPFTVQYTVTGYPRLLEERVIRPEQAIRSIQDLSDQFGPRAVVWRYDPIILSQQTDTAWHLETFRSLLAELEGYVDECALSFMEPYAKTQRNLKPVAAELALREPDEAAKLDLLNELAPMAEEAGVQLTLCTQPALVDASGLPAARCVDADRLSDVAGYEIEAKVKGNRKGCLCHESRDIGAYDTCPHGCLYCYAVNDRDKAVARYKEHRPSDKGLCL
ncbi:MAG: DUF1848 domain-containing protein [Magnetovibrionaceae bacterium]